MARPPRMIDEREVKHSKHKLWLTIIWLLVMLISAVYCALSFVSLKNLQKIYKNNGELSKHNLWSVMTAAALTPALVVLFFVLGTLLLIRKITKESGVTYSLGLLHASTFWLMCVMLQTAVTLHAYIDTATNSWEERPDKIWKDSYTSLYRLTYIFAYILVGCFLFLFLMLFVLKGAMKEVDLGGEPHIAYPPNPLDYDEKHHATHGAHPQHAVVDTVNVKDQPVLPATAEHDYASTGPLAKV